MLSRRLLEISPRRSSMPSSLGAPTRRAVGCLCRSNAVQPSRRRHGVIGRPSAALVGAAFAGANEAPRPCVWPSLPANAPLRSLMLPISLAYCFTQKNDDGGDFFAITMPSPLATHCGQAEETVQPAPIGPLGASPTAPVSTPWNSDRRFG